MTNYAIFNPNNKPIEELPFIIGFNNGGSPKFLHAVLMAEDGEFMGSHCCSHECYMRGDLGILEGTREDRHELFRAHYPNGYRMDFVSYNEVQYHDLLNKALERHEARNKQAKERTHD